MSDQLRFIVNCCSASMGYLSRDFLALVSFRSESVKKYLRDWSSRDL